MKLNKKRITALVRANMDGSGSFRSLLQKSQNNRTVAKTSSLYHAPTIIINLHR